MFPLADRDLLALDDLPPDQLIAILERAVELARLWTARRMPQSLAGRRLALVVNDGGWRNTSAFDLGIQAMGGLCVQAPLRLDQREAVADLGAYLDNWFDAVVCRAPALSTLRALADAAVAPVINARTRQNHPCEVLGDLAWYAQRHGGIGGITVAVLAPEANILGSWVEAAAVLPLQVIQVYPERWHLRGAGRHAAFRATADLAALQEAQIIVTDCWPEGVAAGDDTLLRYQVSASLLARLRPDTEFLPCPPVTRGQEVTADAMQHPSCRAVPAKAFLLHAQNALLEWAFGRF
ncbi:ornithine carbamoyltransferase [Pseudoroseomonas deserti]|uniref:Ornithine carbamoyltransferase n=1 Tax=Teichococcus deserti TaxID=1817963 RepID=A0A1V2H906_9PROT|nr:ornithine carbamoyltransferase [Pseudoroseomonas deserti]ONG58166.1 ornithine carbamoyltransferase [Pseudoroseomonas deserti]